MAYNGENVLEHMIPAENQDVLDRVEGFYREIGWTLFRYGDSPLISVVPPTEDRFVEGLGYWPTLTEHKTAWFEDHSGINEPAPYSDYTSGLRFIRINDLKERPLVLPTEEDFDAVIEHGSDLLLKHTYYRSDNHWGSRDIRFVDPFLYGVRVTGPKI